MHVDRTAQIPCPLLWLPSLDALPAALQIVQALLAGDNPPIPPRVQLPGPDTQQFRGLDEYCALMQRCWALEPEERPAFAEIIQVLR